MVWLLRGVLGLVALGWTAALLRALDNWRNPRWRLTPDDPPVDPDLPISVVVPARDEQDNLGPCLDTIRGQDHPSLQIIVLDDNSSDQTGLILDDHARRDPRIVAMRGDGAPLPEGWFGKPWALQRAQKQATGAWLVFIDADVRLDPAAISRAVSYGEREDVDMVTGLGSLGAESFWEKSLQPAVGGLILAGNNLDDVNNPDKPDKNLANGQFIAVRRSAYDAIGGHGAVRQDILDDIGMARALVAAGKSYRCLQMRTLFYCRMYTGFTEIWEGWTKNLFAGMRYSWFNAAAAVVFTFLFSILGPLLVVLGLLGVVEREWLWWGIGLTVLLQSTRGFIDYLYKQPLVYGLTHAPANVFVIGMVIHSAVRTRFGGVSWKGRTYTPTREASADATQNAEP